jgi:hypothetical protein
VRSIIGATQRRRERLAAFSLVIMTLKPIFSGGAQFRASFRPLQDRKSAMPTANG